MPTENITKFSEAVAASPDLQSKVQSIHTQAAREAAQEIASLASAHGTPFTAEEFLEQTTSQVAALSDEQLDAVVGGAKTANANDIALSIVSFGIACAALAIHSHMKTGRAETCFGR
jgi:predicted ribosomally synthesized peptide with nif11-like leader